MAIVRRFGHTGGMNPSFPRAHLRRLRSGQYELPAICLLAVVLRGLTVAHWWQDTQTDPDIYVALARELAGGDGFCVPGTSQPTAYRPPGYPLFLATLITVEGFDQGLAIPVWNILFDVATIGFVWSWLRWLGSPWVGRCAALLLACDPLMLRYAALPMTEACFTCWATGGTLLLANVIGVHRRNSDRLERGLWGVAGGLLGLAALCRPSIWPFIGIVLAVVAARTLLSSSGRLRWQVSLVEAGYFLLGLMMLVGPWAARNQLVFGRPLLTTTHGGYTLLLANNPVFYNEVARQPWGTVWAGDSLDRWQRQIQLEMETELGPTADEFQRDRWQSRRAWKNIFADPTGFLAGAWYRFRSFWSIAPRGPAVTESRVITFAVGLWYVLLFAAAATGFYHCWRCRVPGLWILLVFVLALQTVHLVYWTDTRMRMPVQPILAIFAAMTLNQRSRK